MGGLAILDEHHEIKISGDGFAARFSFSSWDPTELVLRGEISVCTGAFGRRHTFSRELKALSLADFERLEAYLRTHVSARPTGSIEESLVFVPRSLEFEVEALEGEVCDGVGDYCLRVMVFGRSDSQPRDGLYVGVQGMVSVDETVRWCDEVDRYCRSLRTRGHRRPGNAPPS